ncbi:MAG: GAF domain-containing protein [Chloroflexota bacterium]
MNRPSVDGTPTKPITSSHGPAISPALLNNALDQVMAETLRPVAGGIGGLCGFFAISHLVVLPAEVRAVMMLIAGLTSASMLGVYAYLHSRRIDAQWAHPLAALMALLLLVNPSIHMYLVKDEYQTTYFLLFIIGIGSIFLSTPWFAVLVLAAWGMWGIAFSTLPDAAEWPNYAFAMFAATVLAFIIYTVRVRSALRLERFRIRDAGYKIELENVLKTTEEAQRSLATSMAVGQSITSILDLDTLLANVADLIQLRFSYTFVGIFLLDEPGLHVVCRAGTGPVGHKLVTEGYQVKVGDRGIVGWAAGIRRPVRINDVLNDARYTPLEENSHIRSVLAIPLEMGNRLLGVLEMESDHVAAFQEDDVPFLQLLADQVATAINNASLYQRERASRQLAENLYEIGRVLSGTLELSRVLQLILQHLAAIVYCDRAALLLRREDGSALEILAARGFPDEFLHRPIAVDEGDVFDEIYRTRQPLSIADVTERPDWTQMDGTLITRSWLGIPLVHANEVIGMLSLARKNLQAYQNEEITLAATFAGQAAVALHNARLYEQIKRFNQDLECIVQQRTEALQSAYDRLEHLDQAKSKFISIASHELRTPMTLLKGYAQMLLENPQVRENPAVFPMIQGIESGSNRLHEIIESMLDVARIDNRELQLHPSPFLMPVLLRFVYDGLMPAIEERHIELVEDFQPMPSIAGDLEGLRKVFYHLIINAIKYTPDGGKITLSGRTLAPGELGMDDGGIEVIVSDTGIGIDANLADLIFAKFYQTGEVALHSSGKSKFKGGGPGLGLAIARGIVSAHGGRIWAESPGYNEETCPGSHFHVALPLSPKPL